MRLEARSRRLELALKDLHGILAEAKTNLQRAEEAWDKTWQAYLQNGGKSCYKSGDRMAGAAPARAPGTSRRRD